jgi:hypothetical protein
VGVAHKPVVGQCWQLAKRSLGKAPATATTAMQHTISVAGGHSEKFGRLSRLNKSQIVVVISQQANAGHASGPARQAIRTTHVALLISLGETLRIQLLTCSR